MANQYGISLPDSYLQNNFMYGESGDKLTVNKDSDYYKNTANTIINFVTTELGNLKVLKKPIINTSTATFSDVQQIINTEYDFTIIITSSKILTVNKTNYNFIDEITGISFNRKLHRAFLVENFLLITQDDGTRIDYEISSLGAIGVNADFKTSMRKPVKDKYTGKIEIYQVRTVTAGTTTETKPYKLTETELQEFSISETGTLQFKYDEDLSITRIYYPYQSALGTVDDIPNLVVNDYFITIEPVETSDNGSFYIGNAGITFAGKTTDVSGTYYTSVTTTGTVGKTGLLSYGTIFDSFQDDFTVISIYQNRLVVSDGEYIYFSKVGDYNYFLNGDDDDSAFFIKLSNIRDEKAKILGIIAARGLWVITDKGVFLVGYNQTITGSNIEVRFVGADNCTLECVDINNSLYYMNSKNDLKSVQNITSIKGYVDFAIYTVDKFNFTDSINTLSDYTIDNKKVLLAGLYSFESNSFDADVGAFVYKEENINIFSRTSIEIPLNAISNYESLYIDNDNILSEGTYNMKNAYISLNQPPTHTKMFGYLCNDPTTVYKDLVSKFVTETTEDIKGLICNEVYSNALGSPSQGVYSIYRFQSISGLNLLNRVNITVETSENDSDIELQATETFYLSGKY